MIGMDIISIMGMEVGGHQQDIGLIMKIDFKVVDDLEIMNKLGMMEVIVSWMDGWTSTGSTLASIGLRGSPIG